jgi:DNA-binding NarL/FixJ family response regulator
VITVLVADDHPLFRAALVAAVRSIDTTVSVHEADSFDAATRCLRERTDVDLTLLDLHMPGSHGLMGLAALRAEFPALAVMMISAQDDPQIIARALAHGASGYVSKSAPLEQLRQALQCVMDGGTYVPSHRLAEVQQARQANGAEQETARRLARLTPQQFKVLSLLAQGRLNKQIADDLGIQERTVKAHVSAIFDRLGVRNRTQAGVLLSSLDVQDPIRAHPAVSS